MPRKDLYHDAVRRALEQDGWIITLDPYPLKFGEEDLYIDLGAKVPIGAEKEGCKIAVKIKSFLGKSSMTDLERALGQLTLYRFLLARKEPERMLYLALSETAHDAVLNTADARDLVADINIPLILFDADGEKITRWIE